MGIVVIGVLAVLSVPIMLIVALVKLSWIEDQLSSLGKKIEIADEVSDEKCVACGKNLVVKYGPHGKFLACPGFPECKFTKPFLEKIGVKCPKCGKDIVMRMSAKGRRYYACEKVPECDFMTWQMPAGKMCPKCGDVLVIKGSKLACNNAKCSYTEDAPKKEA